MQIRKALRFVEAGYTFFWFFFNFIFIHLFIFIYFWRTGQFNSSKQRRENTELESLQASQGAHSVTKQSRKLETARHIQMKVWTHAPPPPGGGAGSI